MTRPAPSVVPSASQRLASLMTRVADAGPRRDKADPGGWMPTAAETPAPVRGRPSKRTLGTRISADLGGLAVRMVASASATYARIGLGSIEARVLSTLGAGPHTSSQIGKVIGIDRAAVCRAVQSLMERDLVRKTGGAGRAVTVTEEGGRLIAGIDRLRAERERRLLAGFSEAETAELLGFLGRLMLNVPELVELAESGAFGEGVGSDLAGL